MDRGGRPERAERVPGLWAHWQLVRVGTKREPARGGLWHSGRVGSPVLAFVYFANRFGAEPGKFGSEQGMSRPQRWARAGPLLPLTPKKVNPREATGCGLGVGNPKVWESPPGPGPTSSSAKPKGFGRNESNLGRVLSLCIRYR